MNTRLRVVRHGSRRWIPAIRYLVPLLILVSSGCSAIARGGTNNPFGSASRPDQVRLEIHNDHFNDARIYVMWGGQRQRVGTVVGKTFESFDFEWRPEDFRVEVDLIAGSGFVTDVMVIWPGETVYLQIPPG
jgi:hypothetical protein